MSFKEEMSKEEVHDFGIQDVCSQLEKDGGEIKEVNSEWWKRGHTYFVGIEIGEYYFNGIGVVFALLTNDTTEIDQRVRTSAFAGSFHGARARW